MGINKDITRQLIQIEREDTRKSFNFPFNAVQFVVINNGSRVLKISDGVLSTGNYKFKVSAGKMFVSPIFDFNFLDILPEGLEGSIQPISIYVYADNCGLNFSPGIYTV